MMMRNVVFIFIFISMVAGITSSSVAEAGKKPVKLLNLPEETRLKVEDLIQRVQKQRENWPPKGSVKRIIIGEELAKFCTVPDLVEIHETDHSELFRSASHLLQGSFNDKLDETDIQKLWKYMEVFDPKKTWKGLWVGRTLAKNEKLGIPALTKALTKSKNHFVTIHAAVALAEDEVKVDAKVKRQAVLILLKALTNTDDSGRMASNGLPHLKPWMVQWLITEIYAADNDSALWKRGISRLAGYEGKGYKDQLRSIFLKALKHPAARTRRKGVNGLANLGLKIEDLALYKTIQKDENPHVRRMFYGALRNVKTAWKIPFLMGGLDDTLGDNVETCIYGLLKIKHKPAVPKLVEILKKAPTDPKKPFDKPYRFAGEAISKLTGQPFDFKQEHFSHNGYIRAWGYRDRPDVYRKEIKRLLQWWEKTGSKEDWIKADTAEPVKK